MPKQDPKEQFVEASERLTPKQRVYVEGILNGLNKVQSLTAAGYSDPQHMMRDLDKSPAVQSALRAGRKALAAELKVTKDDVLQGMQDAITSAADSHQLRQAWREIGLLIGAYEPQKIEVDIKKQDLTMEKLLRMRTSELKDALEGDFWVESDEDEMAEEYEVMKDALKRPQLVEKEEQDGDHEDVQDL